MKFEPIDPPRTFDPKPGSPVIISHTANVSLEADEQVTFTTEASELDIARKSWGYYLGGSLNGRLPDHGLRPVIVRGADGKLFMLAVEPGGDEAMAEYCEREGMRVVVWLDQDRLGGLPEQG